MYTQSKEEDLGASFRRGYQMLRGAVTFYFILDLVGFVVGLLGVPYAAEIGEVLGFLILVIIWAGCMWRHGMEREE